MLQCVAVCCSVLQCAAVFCMMLQGVAVHCSAKPNTTFQFDLYHSLRTAQYFLCVTSNLLISHVGLLNQSNKTILNESSESRVDGSCTFLVNVNESRCVTSQVTCRGSFFHVPHTLNDFECE